MATNGTSTSVPAVIAWDYQFAPNAQKARNLLHACGIPYQCCEQPFVQPRPILTDLGITYRRIPVNSIGKDVYVDNRVFVDAIQSLFPDKALERTAADHAFEALGYRSFWMCLPLVPAQLITQEMAKERQDLFSVFSRPDFADLRPNALAEFKSLLDILENDILVDGPWINGSKCTLADIHAIWMVKWAIQTIGVGAEPGFSKKDFPRSYQWLEGLPAHDEQGHAKKISPEEAQKQILSSDYAAAEIGIDVTDATGLQHGTMVNVYTNDDSKPGNTAQLGKLIGLGRREMVIQLENGIRMHFPRIGYVVKQAE